MQAGQESGGNRSTLLPEYRERRTRRHAGHGTDAAGIANIKGKNQWWVDNHEVHGSVAEGPFPHGDHFIVRFKYDVTPKHKGKRMTMDKTGLYTVQNGKIVKEEFFYSM